MKRIFFIIIFLILTLPVFAEEMDNTATSNDIIIEDELLKSKHFHKKIKPINVKIKTPIEDELLNPQMYKDSVFRLGVYTQGEYREIPIEDELIDEEFADNALNAVFTKKEIPDDYFIEKNIDTTKVRKIKAKTRYDFTKKQIPIKIKIANHLKSTKQILEGATIPFVAVHDFEIKGKKYKKGTPILGRIETISQSDKMGVPECLKIDNFYIEDEDNQEINLHGSVSKTGANRSIWVYPLYQAGNICFYVAGFVFVPIHGGRAKVSTEEVFTVFYETN